VALEPDQLADRTSVPLARSPLSPKARLGLWAVRAFSVLVALMVIYAFVAQLES
jgi:hypothetical protein